MHNARPSQTDRRTDVMATARRFVLTNASRDNKGPFSAVTGDVTNSAANIIIINTIINRCKNPESTKIKNILS